MFKVLYHASRVIMGAWFVYSGTMPFIDPAWQPYGATALGQQFTHGMVDSGLMTVVKLVEVVLGITMLLNRAMPLTVVALIPINFVIVFWNVWLEGQDPVSWIFAGLTALFTAVLAWAWRGYFWPLFVWQGEADYSTSWGSFPRNEGRR
jgi:hypothetical protein